MTSCRMRGKPARVAVMPQGWVRLAMRVPAHFSTAFGIFTHYYVSYMGLSLPQVRTLQPRDTLTGSSTAS